MIDDLKTMQKRGCPSHSMRWQMHLIKSVLAERTRVCWTVSQSIITVLIHHFSGRFNCY